MGHGDPLSYLILSCRWTIVSRGILLAVLHIFLMASWGNLLIYQHVLFTANSQPFFSHQPAQMVDTQIMPGFYMIAMIVAVAVIAKKKKKDERSLQKPKFSDRYNLHVRWNKGQLGNFDRCDRHDHRDRNHYPSIDTICISTVAWAIWEFNLIAAFATIKIFLSQRVTTIAAVADQGVSIWSLPSLNTFFDDLSDCRDHMETTHNQRSLVVLFTKIKCLINKI